jgi:SSS family solute:Na+ symporter
MLAMDLTWAIIFFGVTTGAYTIYGGLKSAAWTDFAQVALLLTAGVLIPVLGLMHPNVGGLANLMHEYPQRFQVYLPPKHERFPITGVFTGFLTVGIWYSCTSQHMVQRVLGAKDEWHARMGVVGAGYLRIITPFFFVLPGVIAYKLFPTLQRPDMAYLALVKELIPTGLRGLILAGMAAALMSNVSSVLNSASTIATMDIYGKMIRPQATESELVKFGRISGIVILIVSMLIGYYFSLQKQSLYEQLQSIFFFIAPPFAVIFLVGLLWRRATATAALWTIGLGFAFTSFLVFYAFRHIPWLVPYKTYPAPAFVSWLFCMIVMIVVSLMTKEPPADKVDGVIWDRHYAKLPLELQMKYSGWRDYRIWWAGFVGSILAIYGFFLWWRFEHPASPTSVW